MRIRTAVELGALIRERRQTRTLSQAELAALAGVSRRWLAAVEGGKATVEFDLVLKTLDALGLVISVDESPTVDEQLDLDDVLEAYDEGTQ